MQIALSSKTKSNFNKKFHESTLFRQYTCKVADKVMFAGGITWLKDAEKVVQV